MTRLTEGPVPLERRYLLIAEDGRHTTLGRATEPDQEALDIAAEGLDSLGLAGWYVLAEGATTAWRTRSPCYPSGG